MTKNDKKLEVQDWGLLPYGEALSRQKDLVKARLTEGDPDRLILVEHLPVVTIGSSGGVGDLRISERILQNKGINLYSTNRGGRATFHNPGQMVAYPIIRLKTRDLHHYVHTLLKTMAAVLEEYGLSPEFKKGAPGIWVNNKKIASIGIAVKHWITFHGVALNVCNDLGVFDWIVPCGQPNEKITSMSQELARPIDLEPVKQLFIQKFKEFFDYELHRQAKHPQWLKLPFQQTKTVSTVEELIKRHGLSTVCQSAQCPNQPECFNRRTATFMILGNICTRQCRFCAVEKGRANPVDITEPVRVAQAVRELGLKYAVLTSVTRDDLPDGGATQFARTIVAIQKDCPETKVEVLVPDFKGSAKAVDTVCDARPDMFNHNIETINRLYPQVRPQADFGRSLKVLSMAAQQGIPIKSGLMLGLGESLKEINETLTELIEAGCEYLTIGQYLSPSKKHVPVVRYLLPEEFDSLAQMAKSMGFKGIAAGPLVRSSYQAETLFTSKIRNRNPRQAFRFG